MFSCHWVVAIHLGDDRLCAAPPNLRSGNGTNVVFFGKRGAIVSLQTGEPADVLRLRLCHGTVHALRRVVSSLERPVSPCRVGVLSYHVFRIVITECG